MTPADVTRLTEFQDANAGFAPDLVFNASAVPPRRWPTAAPTR
jgi:hypothetical protein